MKRGIDLVLASVILYTDCPESKIFNEKKYLITLKNKELQFIIIIWIIHAYVENQSQNI